MLGFLDNFLFFRFLFVFYYVRWFWQRQFSNLKRFRMKKTVMNSVSHSLSFFIVKFDRIKFGNINLLVIIAWTGSEKKKKIVWQRCKKYKLKLPNLFYSCCDLTTLSLFLNLSQDSTMQFLKVFLILSIPRAVGLVISIYIYY